MIIWSEMEGVIIGGLIIFILKKLYDIEGKVEKMKVDIEYLKDNYKGGK